MALRSLRSLVRGTMRARTCSSSTGIAVQEVVVVSSAAHNIHVDGRHSPVSAFAGSRGLHNRAEPARRGALRLAGLRELVAEPADVAFATSTAVFFSVLFGFLYLMMNDEDELDKARKEDTHTTYLLQLMEEMKREKASYNKTMPDEKAVVQEYMKDDQAMKARFQEWMKEYGKTYKDEVEKARRYKIFKSVARYTDAVNIHAAKAGHSVCFGVNKFSDWNAEEMARLSGYRTRRDGGYFKMVMSYLAPQWIWYQVADNKEFQD